MQHVSCLGLVNLLPKASTLAACAVLFTHLFAVCKNGVLPNNLLALALKHLHGAGKVYDESMPIDIFSGDFSSYLRILAADYRTICCSDNKYRMCIAKASDKCGLYIGK
jgi:hypothetical protein